MIKLEGLDRLQKKLSDLAENAQKLDGERSVPVTELLTPEFLSKYTRCTSADELFDKSGFKIESADAFKAIPDEDWNAYISSISHFMDWQSMLSKAAEEWIAKKLAL